jgi:hypothetical protein
MSPPATLAGAGVFTCERRRKSKPIRHSAAAADASPSTTLARQPLPVSQPPLLQAPALYGTVGTVAFFDTSAANNSLEIYQNFPIPASSNITYNSITVQNAATLTVGGGSTITVTGSILVTGNSSMVLQSINNAAQVSGTWQGVGVSH